jgi:hypothetical protein
MLAAATALTGYNSLVTYSNDALRLASELTVIGNQIGSAVATGNKAHYNGIMKGAYDVFKHVTGISMYNTSSTEINRVLNYKYQLDTAEILNGINLTQAQEDNDPLRKLAYTVLQDDVNDMRNLE